MQSMVAPSSGASNHLPFAPPPRRPEHAETHPHAPYATPRRWRAKAATRARAQAGALPSVKQFRTEHNARRGPTAGIPARMAASLTLSSPLLFEDVAPLAPHVFARPRRHLQTQGVLG